ncbi:MAG: tetratricopeptide repeat protein, partial [Steroidobacteraceae bacterium]
MMLTRGWRLYGLLLALALTACDSLISPQQRIERARTALDSGKMGLAAIELQKAVRAEPDNSEARFLLARMSLLSGDPVGAQQDLIRAIRAGAKGPAVDALRVETWLATNQPQALIDAFARNELSLAEPERSVALARAYNALGQPEHAIEALASQLTAHPHVTAARLAHAQALVLRGESEQALHEIDAVIEADQRSSAAVLLKGVILMHRGQYAMAEEALVLAHGRTSGSTPLNERAFGLAALTEAQLAQGKIAAASESEGVLLKVAPEAPVTRLLGARLKLARGDYLNGIADLQRLVARAPQFLPARVALGAAQLLQGNLLQSEAQLADVVAQAPDNLEARKLLARVRLQF